MKSAQWLAVLVLALMVGGITFVTVYLGGGSNAGSEVPTETPPALTFAAKIYPQPGQKPLITEVRQRGQQDYWFLNDSGQKVNVGLNEKGCTCSEVEVTLAPETWHVRIFGDAASNAFRLPPRGLDSLTTWMAAQQREHLFPELPDYEATTLVLNKDNSIEVPAGVLGRVRLSWRQTEAKPLLTFADLWMGRREGGARARLDAGVKIAEPMEVSKEITVRSVDIRDLEKMKDGTEVAILCWSMTRRSFHINVKIHDRLKAEADPIEVGEPIPLTREEIQQLEGTDQNMLTVLSGYRIPVRVRAKGKDGTPIDWGFFRRYIELTSPDEGIEPVQVRVTGEVRGDVTLDGGKEGGAINLGPFPRSRSKRGTIVLRTDEDKLDLRLDAKRLPEYLKAWLDPVEQTPAGSRLWKLHVEVPPRAAQGEFPRADNRIYRDSAIYLTAVEEQSGKPPRSIRIPVLGTANEG
jgi:hypothetical protein